MDGVQQAINDLKDLLGKGYTGEMDRVEVALQATELLLWVISQYDMEITEVEQKLDQAMVMAENLGQRVEKLQKETKELKYHNAEIMEYLNTKGLAKDFDRFLQEKKTARILH